MRGSERVYDISMKELDGDYIASLIPARESDSSKADFGSVLNVAGSVNYRGAAAISSALALAVGAGYVTLACPAFLAQTVSAIVPEAVILPLGTRGGCVRGMAYRKVSIAATRARAVSLGCGLSNAAGGTRSLRRFFTRLMISLSGSHVPVVLDADGLNLLAELQPLALPRALIMTPHERELARLLKVSPEAVHADRAGHAERAAQKYSAVVVLKGKGTVITDGERGFVNPTGNSALAKAGSGDALTGMIAGFLAQRLSPLDAACVAVYLHGLAGELAAKELTEYGVLASDLRMFVPRAIRETLDRLR